MRIGNRRPKVSNLPLLVTVLVIYAWMISYLVEVMSSDRPFASGSVPILFSIASITLIPVVVRHALTFDEVGEGGDDSSAEIPPWRAILKPDSALLRSWGLLILTILYVFPGMPFLGMVVATAVFAATSLIVVGVRDWRIVVAVPLALSGTIIAADAAIGLTTINVWGVFEPLFS